MSDNMARFGVDEFVGHVPAFIAFIREINGERPGTFVEPKITAEGLYTTENYPDARVVMRSDRRDNPEAADEGIRVITDNPELIPLWQTVSKKIYAESVTKRQCTRCGNRVEPGQGELCDFCQKNTLVSF